MKEKLMNSAYCSPLAEEIAFSAQSVMAASALEETATLENYTKTDLFE